MRRQLVARIPSVDGGPANESRCLSETHRSESQKFPGPIDAIKSIGHTPLRLSWALIMLAGIVGCGPELSDEELGQIVNRLPTVPGAEVPYPLPDLTVIENKKEAPEDAASEEEKKATTEESKDSSLEKVKEPSTEEAKEASSDHSDS